MRVSAIAAMAANRVIGKDNKLPWNLPEDLRRFKQITQGHPVIMGRKTYESIGRLLPGRENIILTRNPGFAVPGAKVFASLEKAIESCEGRTDEVFIIGGAEIYREAMPRVDRIYLTLIDFPYEGDAKFPVWDESKFRLLSEELFPNSQPPFRFLVFSRLS